MEHLLHYTWKYRLFSPISVSTTDGVSLEIIDVGTHNTQSSGADFFNAKVKIADKIWVGNVEIHTNSSDWYKHKHDIDSAYDNVILHVVEHCDCEIRNSRGEKVNQLVLQCPDNVRRNYSELCLSSRYPCCQNVISQIPKIKITSWLSALQEERINKKSKDILERFTVLGYDWEEVFFISIARNFGFNTNSDAFELWAKYLPYKSISKHRDNLMQVEAMFFGVAGLLNDAGRYSDNPYFCSLKKEYEYLKHKFNISKEIEPSMWRFMRMRPDNFPTIRIAQLAFLYHSNYHFFNKFVNVNDREDISHFLSLDVSEYWKEHYTFDMSEKGKNIVRKFSKSTIDLLTINTFSPLWYAYGTYKNDDDMVTRSRSVLENIPPENNHIIRVWTDAGLVPENAAESQALIQLYKEYCSKRKCLRCVFGYEYIKSNHRLGLSGL